MSVSRTLTSVSSLLALTPWSDPPGLLLSYCLLGLDLRLRELCKSVLLQLFFYTFKIDILACVLIGVTAS
jgi:hypothetical protein